tara:strand:- start:6436 stop:6645 length:210 start_codon:yes stop_codon:yes gene_type:complete
MEQYQIEKDVPMPNGYGSKYSILKRMKKGDSIVIGTGFVAAIRQAAKAWDIKIATRRENLNHHRIWRAD